MKGVLKKLSFVLLAVVSFIMFVGCSVVPDSVEKAVKRMEKQGYNVRVEEASPTYADYGAHTALYMEEKNDPTNSMIALRFNTEGEARFFHGDYKLDVSCEVYRQEEEWVFWGTKEAEYDFTY